MGKSREYKTLFRAIRFGMLRCVMFGILIAAGCGGGGSDSDSGGNDGGSNDLVYAGSTSPTDITSANATRLVTYVFGAGDLAEAIPITSLSISTANPFSGLVPMRLVAEAMRQPLAALENVTPSSVNFSKRVIDESDLCYPEGSALPSGSVTLSGDLNDQDGTGTLTLTYSSCHEGDTLMSGTITCRIDEALFTADTWYPTDATLTFTAITLTTPEMDIRMAGTMRYLVNMDWSETITLNIVMKDNDTQRMQKAENLVISSGYLETYYYETINGRVYDSINGYVDVATDQTFHFDAFDSLYPSSGVLRITGSGGKQLRVTALSEIMALVELNLDNDAVYEISGQIPWEVIAGAGSDPGDSDGDGLDDAWEETYGLSNLTYADAGEDNDGDSLSNWEEFSLGTSPVSSDSDADNMPDGWEVDYGFNPLDNGDAALDFDGDAATNEMEYAHGTNPKDATSTPADLQASISVSLDTVSSQTLFQYTLELTNLGPGIARDVHLTDTLPEGAEVYTVVPGILSAAWDCTAVAGTLTCEPYSGTMGAGETVSIDVPVVAPAELGSFPNTVEITSSAVDFNLANNSAAADVTVDSAVLTQVDVAIDGVGGVEGLASPFKLAISPDGKHIYVPGINDEAVAVFSRDPVDGTLTFVEAEREGIDSSVYADAPKAVAVSPDGQNVYVTKEYGNGAWVGAVVAYSRDPDTGALTLIGEYSGLGGYDKPYSITVSGDGANVYVTVPENAYPSALKDSAVVVFNRDADTGALTFNMAVENGVGGVSGIQMPFDLVLSPDDKFLYVASSGDIAIFSRGVGGALTYAGLMTGLEGQPAIAASSDGKHLYTVGSGLTVISRDPVTGLLTEIATYANGENGIAGMEGMYDLEVAPDGGYVYVAAQYDSALGVFARDPETGSLHFVEVQKNGIGNVEGLGVCWAAAVSPDSAFVYVSGASDNAIGAFSVDLGSER